MDTRRNKRKKHKLHKDLKRFSVLLAGFVPFICYMIVLMQGISLVADGKTGLAFVNTESTGLAVRRMPEPTVCCWTGCQRILRFLLQAPPWMARAPFGTK